MRGLPTVSVGGTLRTRRWDAVILGGALPGLIAAVLLGRRGARVLVLEDDAAADCTADLREPFLMSGAEGGSLLGACLRALGMPLIDRRRIELEPVACQVVLPQCRVDLGEPLRTAEEFVSWGLAKPEHARNLVRDLAEAATAERDAMLAAQVVRAARRLPLGGRRGAAHRPEARQPHRTRGLPDSVRRVDTPLAALLAALVRALSDLGAVEPSPEARTRLLGVALEGRGSFREAGTGLRELFKRRIESLYGEFRRLPDRFQLVSAGEQPGIALVDEGEFWVGRALILNAPRRCLAAALDQSPVPDWLAGPPVTGWRRTLRFRARRDMLPEGMAERVVSVGDAERPMVGSNVVTLRHSPATGRGDCIELLASAVVDPGDPEGCDPEIEAAVRRLMPFAGEGLVRIARAESRWDHDAALCDPPTGQGWPAESDIRISARPPIYALDRAPVAGLGFEGGLLLGWRAGDALAGELT